MFKCVTNKITRRFTGADRWNQSLQSIYYKNILIFWLHYTIFREYTNGELFSRWLLESVTKISVHFYNIWKFQGSIKKEVGFPGVFTKNSCENFHCAFTGPWCLILEFPRGVKQFRRISQGESLFSLEFLRVKWQI